MTRREETPELHDDDLRMCGRGAERPASDPGRCAVASQALTRRPLARILALARRMGRTRGWVKRSATHGPGAKPTVTASRGAGL